MIYLKSEENIEQMRVAGRVCADTLSYLSLLCKPGIMGLELDKKAEEFIRDHGCVPSTIGYQGYKWATCISINAGCVHNPPNNKELLEGDVVKIDLVVDYNGWKSDSALTILIPPVKPETQRLATVGLEALKNGILQAKEGNRVANITQAIFDTVKGTGFSLCREFVGHSCGREIHEAPQVPCIPQQGSSPLLVSGMILCLEPIVIGSLDNSIYMKVGEWPTWALSGANVVHNEETILITSNGPEILTLRKDKK